MNSIVLNYLLCLPLRESMQNASLPNHTYSTILTRGYLY